MYTSTKEKIAVMAAYNDGKAIERISDNGSTQLWLLDPCPSWNWTEFCYRIKPEPKCRAWKPEEVPVGAVIRYKGHATGSNRSLIIDVDTNGMISDGTRPEHGRKHSYYTCNSAFAKCEHSLNNGRTWLPCGVKEDQ